MSASPQLSKAPAPGAERRHNPRRSIVDEQIVAVTLDGDNGGLVLDLAENGVAVQAVTPLQQGKTTEMAFVLGEGCIPIRAHGVVRWAEPSGRAGIRLLAFSKGSQADIRAALLQPAVTPAPSERPPRPPDQGAGLDADSLQKQITARSLEGGPALVYLAERIRELASAGGVALALGDRREMICRASAGAAPAVGALLQGDSGLSGECVRTGLLVRCDDTQADARVDAEICRRLDLRSAVLVPIVDSGEMRGVLEVFSSRPHAFASDDIRRFEQVAALVAKITREPAATLPPVPATPVVRAAAAPPPPVRTPAVSAEVPEASPRFSLPARDLSSPAIKFGAAAAAAIVLALAGWGVLHRRPAARLTAVAATVPAAAPTPAPLETAPPVAPEQVLATHVPRPEPAKTAQEAKVTPKVDDAPAVEPGLAMRQLPSAAPAAQPDPVAPPVIPATTRALPDLAVPAAKPSRPAQTGVVPGRLLRRVEPIYPELALRSHIGGIVVLNAAIGPDGKVGAVRVVSGNPLLARAAVDAVRQWHYEPFRLNGTAVQAEANIRLNFDSSPRPRR